MPYQKKGQKMFSQPSHRCNCAGFTLSHEQLCSHKHSETLSLWMNLLNELRLNLSLHIFSICSQNIMCNYKSVPERANIEHSRLNFVFTHSFIWILFDHIFCAHSHRHLWMQIYFTNSKMVIKKSNFQNSSQHFLQAENTLHSSLTSYAAWQVVEYRRRGWNKAHREWINVFNSYGVMEAHEGDDWPRVGSYILWLW